MNYLGRSGDEEIEQTQAGMLALLGAARKLQDRLDAALAAVGLTGAKYYALEQLASARQPVALSELAGCLKCARSNVTQLMDRLEMDGLVKRIAHPQDRRAVRASLTQLGAERHAAGAEALRVVHAELADKLGPAERELLIRALSALS